MSVEKVPDFRIVGGAPPEKKQEFKEDLQRRLFSHFESLSSKDRKEMTGHEYEKSERTLALIDFANQETNRLRQETGMAPYDIPHENYHIISSKLYEKIKPGGSAASTFLTRQGIIFNAEHFRSNPLLAGTNTLHETLHLKGHTSFAIEESGDEIMADIHRGGVAVSSVPGAKHHEHFSGLDEAIIATQEKKSFPELLDLPVLKKEKEWLMSEKAKEIRRNLALKRGISEDDFFWVDKKDSKPHGFGFPYPALRGVLDYVLAEIQKDNSREYRGTDDVFKEFLKSHFTGQLLPIARLVEKTFGQGSFRMLGNMTGEKESAVLHMEALRKARSRQLKSKEIS